MKKRKTIKIIVICLMCAAVILNSIPSEVMGFATHIVAGGSFFGLMVIHIVLSHKYFFACAKNFFKIKPKAKVNFVLDIVLILLCAAILATGILLARNALPQSTEYHDFETLHGLLGAALIFVIIAHGCLHIKKKRKSNIAKNSRG